MDQILDDAASDEIFDGDIIEVPVIIASVADRPIVTIEEDTEPETSPEPEPIEAEGIRFEPPLNPLTQREQREPTRRRRIPRTEYTSGGGSKPEIPRTDPNYPWLPVTRPLAQQPTVPASDMTEAHERHLNDDPGAYIYTVKCDENGGCVYKDDCPILNALDDQIFECLKIGVIPGIEIRFCEKFAPKHKWSRRL
jgi:hypothetical protein